MQNIKIQEAIAKSIVKSYIGKFAENLLGRIDGIKFCPTNISSRYVFDEQTIYINASNENDINSYVHELFHALSAKKYDNKSVIGFDKVEFTKLPNGEIFKTRIGNSLNEGATHSLTCDATNGRYGKVVVDTHYKFCANIYKNLENIIGKNLLQISYLNGGLNQFFDIVSTVCHTKKENVLNLVLNMDTYFLTHRFYAVFAMNNNAPDAVSLLTNCYSYLGQIVQDYCKYNNKKYDIFENIKNTYLEGQEIITFYNALRNVDKVKTKAYSLKDFEKMAQYIFSQENLNFDEVPANYKTGEFYNYLLINSSIVDEKGEECVIKTFEKRSKLTELIFDEKQKAFNIDENLPFNVRTVLSSRFVVRADTTVSDYYMIKSFSDEKFCNYLKTTDENTYRDILKQINKNEQSL